MSKDGGPAFPVSMDEARGKVASIHGGISIRDYFAAAALQGMLANPAMIDALPTPASAADIATAADIYADAMLAVRETT